jgi:hypothetical protein
MSLSSLARSERANAALGWTFAGVTAAIGIVSVAAGSLAWAGLWFLLSLVVVAPPVVTGDWASLVPWPLPAMAAGAAVVQSVGLYPELAGYVAVASLALVAVVELDVFSSVEMSRRFTVVFAAMTTMAVQAWWTVVQFVSDWWFGTEFLRSQTELQWDIVAVTVVAIVVGGFFVWYFERIDHVGAREYAARSGGSS